MAGLRVAVKQNDRFAVAGNQEVKFDSIDLPPRRRSMPGFSVTLGRTVKDWTVEQSR
jgi:hypothetical protein